MLDTLAAIRTPRSQTAAMQLLQLYVQSGHHHWTGGTVERSKLARLASKLDAAFRISRDAPGRAYDKRAGKASVHLVVLDSPDDVLPWVLVSTAGRGGLADPTAPNVGQVHDTRARGQHLRWHHYELLHAEKRIKRAVTVAGSSQPAQPVRATTWTWRIDPQRVREHEALIVARAKHRDLAALQSEALALAQMPLFSGVRAQVLGLYSELRKVAAKFGAECPELPRLPYMVRLPIYADPAATLYTLTRAPLTAPLAQPVTACSADTAEQ